MSDYTDALRNMLTANRLATMGALEETAPGSDQPEELGPAAHATMDLANSKSMSLLMAQQALNYLKGPGTPLDEDGLDGPNTQGAMKAFQASHHLSPDGQLGPLTAAELAAAVPVAIFSLAAKRLNPSVPTPSLPKLNLPSPSSVLPSILPKDPLGLNQASNAANQAANTIADALKTAVLATAGVAGAAILGVFIWMGLKGKGTRALPARHGGRRH